MARRRWRALGRGAGVLSAMLTLGACGAIGLQAEGGVTDDGAPGADASTDVEALASCGGFTMPNPASSGLPNPASYTANGDGTVTDDVTGLVWQGVVDDTRYMQDEAAAHCAALGAGWRLPTRLELVSLVDFTVAPGPTIDPVFKNTPATIFWTSSPYYGDVGDAWYVGFDEGYSDYGIINQSDLVRCVRPPAPKCLSPRYEAQAGGVVLDRATGLVWQAALDPGSYSWDGAVAYCKSLGTGWRAPSLKEAQTIIDDGLEFPAVDPDAFPDTPSVSFWTSTATADGSGAAWYIDVFYGASYSDVAARLFRVRCVR